LHSNYTLGVGDAEPLGTTDLKEKRDIPSIFSKIPISSLASSIDLDYSVRLVSIAWPWPWQ
jgi:hypothetical protein